MIKNVLLIIALTFIMNAYSQQDSTYVFHIEYSKTLNVANSQSFITLHLLQRYIGSDISIMDKISSTKNPNELVDNKDDDAVFYLTPQGDNFNLVYKDYSTGKIYLKHAIGFKYFLVEDSLKDFNWEILEETKEILGYDCQSASINHRGRTYKAWFAPQLPIGGPWKFDGLPGMILSIKSDDLFLVYEAVSIKSEKIQLPKFDNPFKIKKALDWEDFKKLYKQKAINLSQYLPEEGNSGGIMLPRRGIETYIDENDSDYTADKEFEKAQRKN